MRVPLPDRADTVPDLVAWLQAHGALMDGVSVQQFDGYGLGLLAEQDFEEGDLMLAVPRKLMLSVETARFSELGKYTLNPYDKCNRDYK
jgi:histone-lysine N-methyltransferase SETD3